MNKKLKIAFYFLIFGLTLTLDRFIKSWVVQNLFLWPIKVFPFLNLSLAVNRGVSFGLFSTKTNFWFVALAVLIFLIVIA